MQALAGRDIESTTRSASSAADTNSFGRTTIDRVGGLYVTGAGSGTLVASAGRDVNLLAGQIGNAGTDGVTLVQAGNNLNLGTVNTASSNSLNWNVNNYRKDSDITEVGSQVQTSGAIVLKAGADINARGANVQAGTSLAAIAGKNINVLAGVNAVTVDEGHQHVEKSFLHSELITTHDTLHRTSALGSSLGGTSVDLVAGNDIKVTGSTIAGDGPVNLTAKNAITIAAATETSKEARAYCQGKWLPKRRRRRLRLQLRHAYHQHGPAARRQSSKRAGAQPDRFFWRKPDTERRCSHQYCRQRPHGRERHHSCRQERDDYSGSGQGRRQVH